jgi:hypothetical protein
MPTTTLCSRDSFDSAGTVVEHPAAPDFAWIARRHWESDPARLDALIRAAASGTL